MVTWVLPWSTRDEPEAMMIDRRGHAVMLRCCCVIVLVSIAHKFFKPTGSFPRTRKWLMAPWVNAAECVADLPFP